MAIRSEQEARYPDAPVPSILSGSDFENFCYGVLLGMGITLTPCLTAAEQFNIGENREGYEFKLDETHSKWGHLSIEVAERTKKSGPWHLSGIFRNDNTKIYVQGNKQTFWMIPKVRLLEHAGAIGVVPNSCMAEELSPGPIRESFGTIRKFYLSYGNADKIGTRVGNK